MDDTTEAMKDVSARECEEQGVGLLEILQVLAQRRRLIMKICGAVAAGSLVVSLILPNIYTATSKVIPPQKDSAGGLAALVGQSGGLGSLAGMLTGMSFGGNTELYLGILKSRSVADAVIKRFDLQKVFKKKTPEETRKKLESVVKVKAGTKDGIISIVAEYKDPQLAAGLANAFVEELAKKSVLLNLTKAGTERAFLEKRLDLVKVDLKKAEEDLKSFEEKNKVIKVDSQAAASIQGVARLKAEIVAKEVQLAALKSFQTDENPEVRIVQTTLGKLRSQLAGLIGSGSSDGIPNIGRVPDLGIEYLRKMRELKTQEAIYEHLTKQYEVAKLTEAKDNSSIQVLDEAVVPVKKTKPKRAIIIILSTAIAFLVSVFIAFVLEYFEKIPAEERACWKDLLNILSMRRNRGLRAS